jgi:predicted nucleic acid-binding protein
MILLDTNVISELMREAPAPPVAAWAARQPTESLFVSTITEAELFYGIELLPEGRRRTAIAEAAEAMLSGVFTGRTLPFDSAAALAFAGIAAARRRAGRPMPHADAQIAAVAVSRGLAVATRNIADFEGCGVTLVDPWRGDR